MKIEKINDNQISITLGKHDLEKYDLTINDLLGNRSEKAEELLRELMDVARDDYDFETNDASIVVEAMQINQDYLVFVEVKYREAKDRDGGPLAAVNAVKQKRIIRTARYYMLTHHLPEDTPVRFDVIGMSPGETVHIRDAFHVS